jgi:peptidoglycan/xylan/chitin deacetylase (PgdA/CDA1 family)
MKKIILTFDDVYLSHYTHAVPLLKEYGFPATFYVCPELIKYKITNLKCPIVSWEQAQEIAAAGFDLGNHFMRHFPMPRLSGAEVKQMVVSAEFEFKKYGLPHPVSICYPGFHFNEIVKKAVKETGYKLARAGLLIPEEDYLKGGSGVDYHHHKDDCLEVKCKGVFGENYRFNEFVRDVETIPDAEDVYGIFVFHDLVGSKYIHIDFDDFQRCMDYIKQNEIQVLSMREILI